MFNIFKRKKNPIKFVTFSYPYDGLLGNDSTSFASIDLICSSFASLGFDFYNSWNKEKTGHELKELLLDPNGETTRFDFFYHSAKHIFCNGNCFWYKYDMEGRVVSLFLINPLDVRVQRDPVSNEKLFYYNGGVYTKDKIIHIPSRFGFDGLIGQSLFTVCREIFNNAARLDDYVKNAFQHSTGKRLVIDLSGAGDLDDTQLALYKEKFIRNYTGIENSGVPLIKRRGVDYNVVDSEMNTNQAAQLRENREFNEREIAKLLRVPIELLSNNGKDLETVYTLFLDHAVRPLATQFEQAINKFLLSPLERQNIYFEFSYNSLLKTNLQTRVETYVKQLSNGILTINEVRQKENLPMQEAGDNLFIQGNLLPLKNEVVDSFMASARLKNFELQQLEKEQGESESPSSDFHSENPQGIGDDKI
jgi:HK97 family phage portal protein